jgi:hypothetical protein
MKALKYALALLLTIPLGAQTCPATALPYTDLFTGTGALSLCWTPVAGPSGSTGLIQSGGLATPTKSGAYGVNMFTGLKGVTAIQAAVTYVVSNYSALCFQDATGKGECFIPSLNAIYNMVANSGGSPGGVACTGPAGKSGDTFSLTLAGTTYTATDVTTGKVVCSATSTFVGNPAIQVDWRHTNTDKIGPVTLSGASALIPLNVLPGCSLVPSVSAPTTYTFVGCLATPAAGVGK